MLPPGVGGNILKSQQHFPHHRKVNSFVNAVLIIFTECLLHSRAKLQILKGHAVSGFNTARYQNRLNAAIL